MAARKKKCLDEARLYLVLDRMVADEEALFDILKKSVSCGVDIVQFRDKNGSAASIMRFSRRVLSFLRHRIPYIINDRPDLAKAVGADGVHVGQEDIPLCVARKILGPRAIIGLSCQTLSHCTRAERDGADYIGFGAVFKTLTKPDREPMHLGLLGRIVQKVRIPLFAIGGIDEKNIGLLADQGVHRIAVTRAICEAQDVAEATRHIKSLLTGTER